MAYLDKAHHLEVVFWKHNLGRSVNVYFDLRDWWVGYYRGDDYHYLCLLPTLVIRWGRR